LKYTISLLFIFSESIFHKIKISKKIFFQEIK